MKKILLLFLFIATLTLSQDHFLSNGGVQGAQNVIGPGGSVAWDFELCCGGGTETFVGNGFDYDDNFFNLHYKGTGCLVGCNVSGTVDTWFLPQSLGRYCVIQSALLTVNFSAYNSYTARPAEYSQMFCTRNGSHWGGPGALVVHVQ